MKFSDGRILKFTAIVSRYLHGRADRRDAVLNEMRYQRKSEIGIGSSVLHYRRIRVDVERDNSSQ